VDRAVAAEAGVLSNGGLCRPEPARISTLAEAGQLLGALDSEEDLPPQSLFEDTGPARAEEAQPETAAREVPAIEDIAGLASAAASETPKRRRRHGRSSKGFRLLLRIAAGLIAALGISWGGIAGYQYVNVAMASPAKLLKEAERAFVAGEYRRASELYMQFAQQNPGDPRRAEAQFAAAFSLQLVTAGSSDAQRENTRRALELFETFRNENPTHPKTARAETIMGRLLYDSGQFKEAIELLRNPELRLKDPVAAVPALRTLARAYAQLGDEQAARSYFLQSVGAQDNHSPDVDYAELGSLYHSLAERENDPDRKIELEQLAIEYWEHALQTPGIEPSSKQILRTQVSVLREHLMSEPGMAPAMEALEEADVLDSMPMSELREHGMGEDIPTEGPGEASLQPASVDTEPAAEVYVVRKGDALSVIAANHGVTLDAVMEENRLTDPNLKIGQRLIIPATAR
jgi:tetratricopeptide (TPR) repeat protein